MLLVSLHARYCTPRAVRLARLLDIIAPVSLLLLVFLLFD